MPEFKFTVAKIRGLENGEKQVVHADLETPGLKVRVLPKPSLKKTYFVDYRIANIKNTRGTYTVGDTREISLEDARKMAGEVRRIARSGKKPNSKVEISPKEMTVKEMNDEYLEHSKRQENSDFTIELKKKHFDWLNAHIGKMKASEVTTDLCRVLHRDYPHGSTSANRMRANFKASFNFAIRNEKLSRNPVNNVEKNPEAPREDNKFSPSELKTLLSCCDQLPLRSNLYYSIRITTACRQGELLKTPWVEMNTETKIWTKLSSVTKNKTPSRLKLTDRVVGLLKEYHKKKKPEETDIIFGDFSKSGLSKSWRQLKSLAEINLEFDLKPHDLRRSVAEMLLESGKASMQEISSLLGHQSVRTTERVYAKYRGDNSQTVSNIASLLDL